MTKTSEDASVRDAGRGSTSGLRDRERAESLWSVSVDRAPAQRDGARGVLSAPVKALLRPFIRWYVAPLVDAQRDFNDVTLKLIDDLHEQLGLQLDERLLHELEERVLRLERLGRTAVSRTSPETPTSTSAGVSATLPFDYFTFEARMRGSRDNVQTRKHVYVADFHGAAPVLDLGCGRGEFLALLRDAGMDASGVDSNHDMVEACRSEGLEATHGDVLTHLESLDDESLGGVFAAHLLEHLSPAPLVRLLELVVAKLRPGGLLVAETPNPLSFVALKNYFADLTHAQPLVPETLVLLARQTGFSRTELRFLNEPPTEERLRPVELPSGPQFDQARVALAANVARVNDVVFGPQDYALIAHR